MNIAKVLILLGATSVSVCAAQGARTEFYGNAARHCPDKDQSVKWVDYISGVKAPVGKMTGNPYGIVFQFARAAGADAIGGLKSNLCYNGAFVTKPAGSFPKRGFYSTSPRGAQYHGQPGDPLIHEINVDGVMFHYSDIGVLYNIKGQRVGTLVCYPAYDCTAY